MAAQGSSLRKDVSGKLLDLVISGRICPGRINESDLARRMRVSRTPLREALVALEGAGFVISQERGFAVPELRAIEIREIYPIIATLEALALETAGRPDAASSSRLRRLNVSFRRSANDAASALAADGQFHHALLANCPNRRLMDLLARQKSLVRRYELLYFRERRFFERSAEQHDRVIDSLGRNDMESAVEALKSNWTCALDLITWSLRS
jgi:DNA-binding GntR family transcriptional regulator